VFDKLATVGLLNAALYPGDEPILVFEHTANRILYQLLNIFAVRKGHLLKPCFHIWCEMYFHGLQVTRKQKPRHRCVSICQALCL
jgi:hypothetical protein